jgi:hypothetical protein
MKIAIFTTDNLDVWRRDVLPKLILGTAPKGEGYLGW